MMEKILIFGNSSFAELVYYMFKNYSNYNVVAFVVDKEFKDNDCFCSLPLLNTESTFQNYSIYEYKFFVAVGYSDMNKVRAQKYLQIKGAGYSFVNFIHPTAIIAENVKKGENVLIFENTVIQPYVKINDNVFIWASSTICHHSVINNNSFIASNVCINGRVIIEENCFIGAGSIIKNDVKIEKYSLIGAGCTVLENTDPGYVCKANKNITIK